MASRVAHGVTALLEKMESEDADFRYMALSDLMAEVRKTGFYQLDQNLEIKVVAKVLDLMKDQNGEVKNMAVRCLGVLVSRINPNQMQTVVDRLMEYISSKEEEQRDIASLGLKTVLAELPVDAELSTVACTKLAPKLVAQVTDSSASHELIMDSLDLLADLFTRFPSIPAADPKLQRSALDACLAALPHDRAAVRKRAVTALGALAATSVSEIFTALASAIISALGSEDKMSDGDSAERTKTMVQLIATLARTCPRRIGRRLPELMPRVVETVARDDDELREACLQAMESIVLRCPAEVTPFVGQILEQAIGLLKHDPNYAGDDSDEEMTPADEDEDEEEDEEMLEDDYSDDDDMSWKVRRAAAKAITAVLTTRSEQLASFVGYVGPVLVSRFSEREESVRLEVLQTFLSLLRQLQLHAGTPQVTEVFGQSPGALKRKREEMETDVNTSSATSSAGSPRGQLQQLVPAIAKALNREIVSKSIPTRFASYSVLRELVGVLQGGLDAQIALIVGQTEKALKGADAASGSGANLRGEILVFLKALFQFHAPQTFEAQLASLVPIIVGAINDKLHRDTLEAFAVSRQLVSALYPLSAAGAGSAAYKSAVEQIYAATIARIRRADSDQEIKDQGIATLGVLLAHAGGDLTSQLGEVLPELLERLRNEVTRYAAVKVAGQIAQSPACAGNTYDDYVQQCITEVATLLRKSNRQLKLAAFDCLAALLRRASASFDDASVDAILVEIQPLLSQDIDLNLLPLALKVVNLLVEIRPKTAPARVQAEIMPAILEILGSPLMQSNALDAITVFFKTYVKVDPSLAQPTVESLLAVLQPSVRAQPMNGSHIPATVARCVGASLVGVPEQAAGVVQKASATLAKPGRLGETEVYFSLLLIGEIGRFDDMSKRPGVFDNVVGFYRNASEELKTAAAFAVGNMAVGNLEAFLPVLEQQLKASDAKERLLSLRALKELITHAQTQALAAIAERIWVPLFDLCEEADEATRNIGAECLARLTLTDARTYLPQLKSRLHAPSAATRAAVIAAVRFTLTESSAAYDELLSTSIVEFLSLLQDENLDVRRHAVFALNSAAHNKSYLISEHLVILLPLLYQETHPRKELLRKVIMGPFTVTYDDGLDLRKTAFETMLTLLDTSFSKINIVNYIERVVAGLEDEDGIKVLCYLILVRLAEVAPLQVAQHLEDIAPKLSGTLKQKPKDTASKQDMEKTAELQRSILRALIALETVPGAANAAKFQVLVREAKAVPGDAYAAAQQAASTRDSGASA